MNGELVFLLISHKGGIAMKFAEQNFTMNKVIVYTRTHVRIPAIKCSNVTRTVCTKVFFRFSLSVISDQTVTSATSSHFCRNLDRQKKTDGEELIQVSPNKWITNNELQYSYGWLGVKCQSTTNFIFIKGKIFLYDGKGLLSDFDNVERCTAISGKCVTNNGIVLWDGEEVGKSCPYRKIGEFDAQLSGSHVIIDKLQTSFIFKENRTIMNSNCNFIEPYLMNGDIIIDKGTNNLTNNLRKQRSDPESELIMKEVSGREETELNEFDPRNIKYQYLFDVL